MYTLQTGQARGAWRIVLAALLAAGALTLAACGSSASTSSNNGSSSTQASNGASGAVKASCDAVTKAEAPLKFVGPASGFDVAKAKGKTVAWINFGKSETGVEITAGAVEASKKLGFTIQEFNGNFDPVNWNKGVQQAVNAKVNAIALFAIDPHLVTQSTAAAKAAGIPVVYVLGPDPIKPFGNEDADVSFPFADAGTMIANYAMCSTKAKVHAQVVTDTTYPNSATMQDAAKAVFANCADCKISVANLPLATWPQRVSTTVKTSLLANPDINFVWPLYDFGAPFAAQAIAGAGAAARVGLAAANGDPTSLQQICKGTQSASAAMPTSWLGWAAADQLARVMTGAKAVDQRVPIRLMTKQSLKCPVPDQNQRFGGADFRAGYEKVWSHGA